MWSGRSPNNPRKLAVPNGRNGSPYGRYALDAQVLVEAQLHAFEEFGFDHVSAITVAREACDCGAAIHYWLGNACHAQGDGAAARQLLNDLIAYARELRTTPASIGYFATSLPAMLLIEDDLQLRRTVTAYFLEAQARLALGQRARARKLL